jgi:2-oxo-4-hydroxy-4-carboxy--5-ureidoimidazoline (OHCU) decarboxylase
VAADLAGIRSDDPNRAYRAADAWCARPAAGDVEDVTASDDALDVAAMTIEERNRLKREILRQHPHLAEQLSQAIAAD